MSAFSMFPPTTTTDVLNTVRPAGSVIAIDAPIVSSARVAIAWYVMSSPITTNVDGVSPSDVLSTAKDSVSFRIAMAPEVREDKVEAPPAPGYESYASVAVQVTVVVCGRIVLSTRAMNETV